jgi:hypothetical protein
MVGCLVDARVLVSRSQLFGLHHPERSSPSASVVVLVRPLIGAIRIGSMLTARSDAPSSLGCSGGSPKPKGVT